MFTEIFERGLKVAFVGLCSLLVAIGICIAAWQTDLFGWKSAFTISVAAVAFWLLYARYQANRDITAIEEENDTDL